jgi:glycosyltransferase involved in cell wall biosynthesis
MEGVAVHVVAPAAKGLPASEQIDGIPVTRFRYAPRDYETLAYTGTMVDSVAGSWSGKFAMVSFLGAAFMAMLRERRVFQPDIIHAHWWFPNGLVGMWTSTFTKVPLVTTMHGTDIRMLSTVPALKPLARHVLNRSTSVTTVSHWLAQQGETLMARTTPLVAPMPAAVEWFTPAGARIPDRILFVGRLNAQKGIEYAIRAIAAMSTPASLDVIGTSPSVSDYQTLAKTLGVADRIFFLGAIAQHELAPFYRRAAALVVPSIDEGLGLVAVEAQLCETPVVAFASGGITDVIQHERTGLLVPPHNVEALASALDRLLHSPPLAAELGRAGREQALTTFAPTSVAHRYAGIYREALQRRAA